MSLESRPFYGSIKWANQSLVIAIAEVYGSGDLGSRAFIVQYLLKEFARFGYRWQIQILRAHIHRAMKSGRFSFTASKEADPSKDDGEASS